MSIEPIAYSTPLPTSWRALSTGGLLAVCVGVAGAQTLPAPPVSPTPVSKYEYDANGNPTKRVVAPSTKAYATKDEYDTLGRRKKSTNAKSGVTDLGYDLLDQLTSVTDPKRLITQYKPTGLGDVEQLISPDTGTANSTFDAAGNVKTSTDARGVLATWDFDELNRPKQVIYSKAGNANRTIIWTYDQTGASFGYGAGRLTTAATPDANTTFRYDALGHVTMTVQTAGGYALVVNSEFDLADHLTKLTYPSGRVVEFGWANGQPQSVKVTAGTTAKTVLDQITRSPFGPIKSWVWQFAGTPKSHTREFDTNGRMVRHPLGPLVRDLTYDDADRISRYTHYTAATAAAAPAYDQVFGYDELDRLTSVTGGSINYGYTYDANGSRLTTQAGSTTRTFTVSATSNRIDSRTDPARSWGYDLAGNTTSDIQAGASSNHTSTYSLEGRWAAMSQGSSLGAVFGYDAMGRRVTRGQWAGSPSNPRTYTLFAYDGSNHLIGEYTSTGAPISEYVWLGDIPVAVIKSDATAPGGFLIYAIHTDHLDTPRVIVDAQGNVRWRWMGEPFGATPAEEQPTASLAALQQNLRFPGQQYEPLGGRHYNHFRDYDPTTGRYVQSDPIGLAAGSMSTYNYVDANPLDGVDPLGLANGSAAQMWMKPHSECPPQKCVHLIITRHRGVCDNNPDPMCAAGMQAAGFEGPYRSYETAVDWACLLNLGIQVKATGGVAGELLVRKGPEAAGALARKGIGLISKEAGAGVGEVLEAGGGRAAAFFGSTPISTVSVSFGVAKLIEHCTCSRQ